jgi:hypothetical protein
MSPTAFRPILSALCAALLLVSSGASAQWALVAKRAIGRVEQMSQQSPQSTGPSYDSAAVMLEAPADKVYAAVVRGVKGAEPKGITITREDAGAMVVQFTNGEQIAGIKVNPLSETLTQLLVNSAHTGTQPNAAAMVLESVLRVCREMGVECAPRQP